MGRLRRGKSTVRSSDLSLSLSLIILLFFFVFAVTDSTFSAFPRDPSFQWPHQRAPRLDVVCESDSEGLRYQACEPVLEVGTCEPNHQLNTIVEGAGAAGERDNNHDHQGMSKWAMLDLLVTSHDLGNDQDSSSKGAAKYEDANAPFSVNQINPQHISLRGEMDFWGYKK
ncbi:hypothetical protein FF1_042868 [Malus domestica]